MIALRQNKYTLLEIVIVIAMMALLTSVVLVAVGRQPASLAVDSASASLQKLFSSALFLAQSTDRKIEIVFDNEVKEFRIQSDSSVKIFSELSFKVPSSVEIEFPEKTDQVIYKFYPDGTGGGPSFFLNSKDKHLKHSISTISGVLIAQKVER